MFIEVLECMANAIRIQNLHFIVVPGDGDGFAKQHMPTQCFAHRVTNGIEYILNLLLPIT